ncbi:Auxin-responsive protein SAUR72, partial [Mucuna pruriens]
MEFVKKCKKVLGSSKRLNPENNESCSYGRLRKKEMKKQSGVAPQGCLCVYVGAERERFVIKIKIANHPLFKALLDAGEREYGYRNDGPLWLPCHVDFFCEALAEMENSLDHMGCAFPMGQHKHCHSPSSPSNLSFAADYELLMEFVKKCKRLIWGRHPKKNGSDRYGKKRVAPRGCIYVYVGAERERFVIKIKIANHPLFKTLLDASESEYGYRNDGPLWLPCHVVFFCQALAKMENTQLP